MLHALHSLVAFALAGNPMGTFEPARIPFEALKPGASSKHLEMLANAIATTGIVQITDVPGYAAGRKAVLTSASACDDWSQVHTFDDHTTRRTIATHTIPGPGGMQEMKITKDTKACEEFKALSGPFRQGVDVSVRLFGERLSDLLGVHTETPMLATRAGFPFETFAHVVDGGEHLGHFHAYTKETTAASTVAEVPSAAATNDEGETLQMHTDQGLFIAFTPALVAGANGNVPAANSKDDSNFLVRLADGSIRSVAFDADSLVFMMGHGVEQVIRPKLIRDGLAPSSPSSAFMPRPTPHALTVAPPRDDPSARRIWYGRMVLPPHDAAMAGTDVTYGEMRAAMNAKVKSGTTSSSSSPAVALGCSSGGGPAADTSLLELHRRVLSEPATCAEGTGLNCWHRCMPLADGDGSGTNDALNCTGRGLQLQCVNSRDQITTGGHGDYFPSCTNTVQVETPYPQLDQSKRTATCDDAGAFLAATDEMVAEGGYLASANLTALCGAVRFGPGQSPGTPCLKGRLMWKVVGKAVHAKMVVNGAFGWLAVGLRNPGGAHNGMNGGRIVMALPGSPVSYSAATGLDLSSGPTVNEYIINEVGGSAFRFWKTPYAQPSVTAASFEVADCHTAMAFSTSAISGWALNVTGTDELIWALNDADTFVGYHSSDHRGLLTANWADGLLGAPTHSHAAEGTVPFGGVAGIAIGAATLGLALGALATMLACQRAARAPEAPTSAKTVEVQMDPLAATNAA